MLAGTFIFTVPFFALQNMPFFYNNDDGQGTWETPEGAFPRNTLQADETEVENKEEEDNGDVQSAGGGGGEGSFDDAIEGEHSLQSSTSRDVHKECGSGYGDQGNVEGGSDGSNDPVMCSSFETAVAEVRPAAVEPAAGKPFVGEGEPSVGEGEPSTAAMSAARAPSSSRVFMVGEHVEVLGRHWKGINKHGGTAIIKKVNDDGTCSCELVENRDGMDGLS